MAKKKNAKDVQAGSNNEDQELFLAALEEMSDEDIAQKLASEIEKEAESLSTKKKNLQDLRLDLHGLTLSEALAVVRKELNTLRDQKNYSLVHVITGRGRHSEAGKGVLVFEIYEVLYREFGEDFHFLDSDPGKDILNGVPIRGFFRLRLK